MKKVAVILSGSGVFDGSEIHEAVITLLTLDKAGLSYQCMAPDMEQMHVINHFKGEVSEGESRNVLVEAARIARGDILDLAQANPSDYDAVILPGGFGGAKNLSNFAVKGADCEVHTDVLAFCQGMADQGKPLGFVCITPVMVAKIFGEGIKVTTGDEDKDVAAAIDAMGGLFMSCPVDEFVVDEDRKIVSTPAYMYSARISEVAAGIEKLVHKVIELSA